MDINDHHNHTAYANNRRRFAFGVLGVFGMVAALLIYMSSAAFAAFNPEINYQGKLTNASNSAVADGVYHMRFYLYTAASGGTLVHTEDRSDIAGNRVTVTNGLFSVMLGSSTSLVGIDFDQPLYLEVEIGGTSSSSWETLSPRKRLGAVPAAFIADTLDGIDSTDFVRADEPSTIASTSLATLLTITQSGTGDILNVLDGSTEVFTILDGGAVGVGSTSPSERLSIGGNVFASGNLTATNITATGTLTTGALSLASLTGPLQAVNGTVSASSTLMDAFISDALTVTGGTIGSNTIASGATWSTAGTLTIGDGGDRIDIATSGWDVTNSVITGATWQGNTIGVGYGGTGISTTPNDGEILIGDGLGYTLTTLTAGSGISIANGTGSITITNSSTTQWTTSGNKISYSSGTVGIGTTTPYWTLQVASATTPYLALTNMAGSSGNKHWLLSNSGDSIFRIGRATDALTSTSTLLMIDSSNNNFRVGAQSGTSTGTHNIGIGYQSLLSNTMGDYNVALGKNVLDANSTGSYNIALSEFALSDNTIGDYNIALGYYALKENSIGNSSVAIGQSALAAGNNVILSVGIGDSAGYGAQTSDIGSTYLGAYSGYALIGTQARNTFLGYQAGFNVTSGSNNLLIGASSSPNLTTGSNNLVIGNNTFVASPSGSNQLAIGNLIYGSLPATSTAFAYPTSGALGIGSTSPNALLSLHAHNSAVGDLFTIGSSTGGAATTTYFTLKNNGYVGMGSNAPQSLLYLRANTSGSNSYAGGSIFLDNAGSGESGLVLKNSSTGANQWFAGLNESSNFSVAYGTSYIGSNYRLLLETNGTATFGDSSSSVNETVVVTSPADAGIQIIADTDDTIEGHNPYLYLSQDGSSVNGLLGLVGSAGDSPYSGTYTNTATNAFLFGTNSTHPVQFGTDGAVRMTIGTGGLVGIGTTSPIDTLSVAGDIVATGQFFGNMYDSISAPSFSWLNDANTGFYLPSADTIGITLGGTAVADFATDGLNLVTGDTYQINGTTVLSATALGSGVTSSSLTSVGTLSALTVSGATTLATASITNLSANYLAVGQSATTTLTTDGYLLTQRIGVGTTTPYWTTQIASATTPYLALTNMAGSSGNKHWLLSNSGDGIFRIGKATNALTSTSSWFMLDSAGNNLIALGGNTSLGTSTGDYNIALGRSSFTSNTTGSYNNALGYSALRLNRTGSYNNAFGSDALYNNTTGSYNNALGLFALTTNTAGRDNNAFGASSLYNNTTGSYNNAIGNWALINNTTGSFNDALGYRAGYNTTGHSNIALGKNAGYNLTSSQGSIALGSDTYFPSATTNLQLNIGNLIYGSLPATSTAFAYPTSGALGIGSTSPNALLSLHAHNSAVGDLFTIGSSTGGAATSTYLVVKSDGMVGIGTTTPSRFFSVQGDVYVAGSLYDTTNSAGSNGYVLQSTGAGMTWVATSSLGITGGSGSGSVNSGTSGYFAYYPSSDTTVDDQTVLNLSGSNIGIGTSTPTARLAVDTTSLGATNAFSIGSSTRTVFNIKSNGAVGIGTTTANDYLTIDAYGGAGGITLTGSANAALYTYIQNRSTHANAFSSFTGYNHRSSFADYGVGSMNATAGVYNDRAYLYGGGSFSNGVSIVAASSSADVRFFTGGETAAHERLRITAAGNLGIGTTSPHARLSIDTTSLSTTSAFMVGSSTKTLFNIASNGNISIGTTTSDNLIVADVGTKFGGMDLYGNSNFVGYTTKNFSSGASAFASYSAYNNRGTGADIGIGSENTTAEVYGDRGYMWSGLGYSRGLSLIAASSSADIRFFTGGETAAHERLRITAAGNLGIGTTSPMSLLALSSASGLDGATPTGITLHSTNNGTWTDESVFGQLLFSTADVTSNSGVRAALKAYADDTTGADVGLSFFTTTAGSGGVTERMRINHLGYVGIGSTSPSALLSITNTGTVDTMSIEHTTRKITINDSNQLSFGGDTSWFTSSMAAPDIKINSTSTSYGGSIYLANWNDSSVAGPLIQFGRSRSGTPGSYSAALDGDVLGALSFSSDDGDSGWNRAAMIAAYAEGNTSSASSSANLRFLTANANNTPTERMRITKDGNVGIGDQTPTALFTVGAGDLFQVNSSGAIAAVTGITSSGHSALTTASTTNLTANYLAVGQSASTTISTTGVLTTQQIAIGTTTPGYVLSVVGSAHFGAGTTATRRAEFDSDGRLLLKYNNNGLNNVLTLENTNLTAAGQGVGALFTLGDSNNTGVNAARITAIAENSTYTGSTADASLAFYTAANGSLSQQMTITSLGSVGIGTTSPHARLAVDSASLGTTSAFMVGSSTKTLFNIASNGDIGIGTTTLSDLVTIDTGTQNGGVLLVGNPSSGGVSFNARNLNSSATSWANFYAENHRISGSDFGVGSQNATAEVYADRAYVWAGYGFSKGLSLVAASSSADIRFFTGGETAAYERVRVTSAGALGVGSTSPNALLTVHANSSFANDLFNISRSTASATSTYAVMDQRGYFGLGTTTPNWQLQIASSSPYLALTDINAAAGSKHLLLSNNDGVFEIGTSSDSLTSTSSAFSYSAVGSPTLGVGTSSPWRTLSVTGSVALDGLSAVSGTDQSVCIDPNTKEITTQSGDTCAVSAARYKHDIESLELSALALMRELEPVSYKYNGDTSSTTYWGLIADNAASTSPELAYFNPDGSVQTLNTFGFLALFTKSIKELDLNLEAIVNESATTTPESENFRNAFFARIGKWLGEATNGISSLFADQVRTRELCVADVSGAETCVTKAQLDALLTGAGESANNGGGNSGGGDEPTPDPDPEPTPEDLGNGTEGDTGEVSTDSGPPPQPASVPQSEQTEPTPDPDPEPTPDSVPEQTPDPEPTLAPEPEQP